VFGRERRCSFDGTNQHGRGSPTVVTTSGTEEREHRARGMDEDMAHPRERSQTMSLPGEGPRQLDHWMVTWAACCC